MLQDSSTACNDAHTKGTLEDKTHDTYLPAEHVLEVFDAYAATAISVKGVKRLLDPAEPLLTVLYFSPVNKRCHPVVVPARRVHVSDQIRTSLQKKPHNTSVLKGFVFSCLGTCFSLR